MLNLGETFAWEFKAQTPLVVTMNSIDIAGLVGSRHDSVKRAIERLAATGVISKPPMVDGEKSANGIVTKVCVFEGEQGKRDSVITTVNQKPKRKVYHFLARNIVNFGTITS